jgi:acetolactate synthase I/II/III large subunit
MDDMNGAVSLLQTLINGGIEVCFTNPGTSEMHFVAALDKVEGMRTVLGLFEGVCTGAADGYARMTGKPAATLLHLGPGLGNGLANLHNARRASSPVVNIVGDHATYHLQHDPPLATDIESMAKTVSGWVRTCGDASSVPKDAAAAIAASLKPPGRVATLILPADCCWNESAAPFASPEISKPSSVDPETIDRIAGVLRAGESAVILMADPFLMETPLWLAGRISRATNARLIANRVNSRFQRGAGRVNIARLPYPVRPALEMLQGTKHLVLVGAKPPVSFFAWPNLPNWLTPDGCQIHTLATPEEDGVAALEMLAGAVDAPAEPEAVQDLKRPPLPGGKITAEKVWISLAALMPEHAVISDEAVTSSRNADEWMAGAPPHDWLSIMGGAIGQGMPVATGAAAACPDRKVFSMQADGSGMYTLQSLWTQAHENLDIVTVLFANHSYKILAGELSRVGVDWACPKAEKLFDLANPQIDWVKLANGMGVHAERAGTAEKFNAHLKEAIQTHGPHLIEVVL